MSVIERQGQSLKAARCERCGARLYPPDLLQDHLAQHEQADRNFKRGNKWLRRKLNGKKQIE